MLTWEDVGRIARSLRLTRPMPDILTAGEVQSRILGRFGLGSAAVSDSLIRSLLSAIDALDLEARHRCSAPMPN
ncbi:MAG: hypothetical protein ACRDKL_03460 [Solirubrobacteraceae bacterium]